MNLNKKTLKLTKKTLFLYKKNADALNSNFYFSQDPTASTLITIGTGQHPQN